MRTEAASKTWAREVKKAMDVVAPPTVRTREQIEADIADCASQLKGSMHPACRLDTIEARAVLRKQLARLA